MGLTYQKMATWFEVWSWKYRGHGTYGHSPTNDYMLLEAPWATGTATLYLNRPTTFQAQLEAQVLEHVALTALPPIHPVLRRVRALRARAARSPKGSVTRRALRQQARDYARWAAETTWVKCQLQRDSGHYRD